MRAGRAGRALAAVAGGALVVVGGVLVVRGAPGALGGLALWLAAAVVLHDGVLAPATRLGGALLSRLVGPRGAARAAAVSAVVVAGVLTLVSVPNLAVRALGARNPSIHSTDYGVVLAAAWAAAALVVLGAAVSRRRGRARRGATR